MVERSLSMREAPGSIPGLSNIFHPYNADSDHRACHGAARKHRRRSGLGCGRVSRCCVLQVHHSGNVGPSSCVGRLLTIW